MSEPDHNVEQGMYGLTGKMTAVADQRDTLNPPVGVYGLPRRGTD